MNPTCPCPPDPDPDADEPELDDEDDDDSLSEMSVEWTSTANMSSTVRKRSEFLVRSTTPREMSWVRSVAHSWTEPPDPPPPRWTPSNRPPTRLKRSWRESWQTRKRDLSYFAHWFYFDELLE